MQASLNYLATCPVGELNVAFRTTLDAFSYRLDAWYTARASRRLENMRAAQPTGLYVGGYAWVENLKRDTRPDSDGYVLTPSLGQAASAAILRSGFLANHEQGVFNIDLDSKRTRRALDILQGLTRDQPLAALYGYRIERGLRDGLLGKLIWPLRLAYPWRPAGADPGDESKESIGARDVVDGVALLAAWQDSKANVWTRIQSVVVNGIKPFATLNNAEKQAFESVVNDAVDLADSVSDLLMAEGVHQIVQGNFERASAAMAVADKQSLPIETQVARTPRGGASYTQRVAVICPSAADNGWPVDRRANAEPSLNAWLAFMLGAPDRYVFSALVYRGTTEDGQAIIDADPVSVTHDGTRLLPALRRARRHHGIQAQPERPGRHRPARPRGGCADRQARQPRNRQRPGHPAGSGQRQSRAGLFRGLRHHPARPARQGAARNAQGSGGAG